MKANGKELKAKGIKKAIDHANEVSKLWSEEAFEVLKKYLVR